MASPATSTATLSFSAVIPVILNSIPFGNASRIPSAKLTISFLVLVPPISFSPAVQIIESSL